MTRHSDPVLPTPEDLEDYLALHGWSLGDSGSAASLWRNSDPQQRGDRAAAAVLVPRISSASDYERRVQFLLQELANLEGRHSDDIRQDAALVHFDVVPLRVNGATDYDSIPLDAASKLFQSARKIITAAAGATLRRSTHFGRSLPQAARKHARLVRVGHTHKGSYVVPLISRARFSTDDLTGGSLDLEVEESLFERRVLATLAHAVGIIAVLADTPRAPTKGELTDAVSEGVSRELCVGIIKAIQPAAIGSLDLQFRWAPTTTPPRGAPSGVKFVDEAQPVLEEIADRLRVLHEPMQQVIFGAVTHLEHRPDEEEGRVGVEAVVGRRLRTVWMTLTEEQYEIAQRCHRRIKVVVRGKLHAPKANARRWTSTTLGQMCR